MTLAVDCAALDAFAAQVGRAADDARDTQAYLERYHQTGWEGALITIVGNTHQESYDAGLTALGGLGTALGGSRDGLHWSSSYYRNTDQGIAADMDATFPGYCAVAPTTVEAEWADSGSAPSFSDSMDPDGRLTAPPDTAYDHPFAWMDNLSISHWALKGFAHVFGFNPLEWITGQVAGDWQAIAKAGIAFGNAADSVNDIGYNVQGGAIALQNGWRGEAGEAAYGYFTNMVGGMDTLVEPMKECAVQFDRIAQAVWSTQEAFTGWVKGLLDSAIIVGLSKVAEFVTAETLVGPVLCSAAATIQITYMLRTWAQITAAMAKLYGTVQACIGVIAGQISKIYNADIPNVADTPPYQHPMHA